jgi:hypothetical protein
MNMERTYMFGDEFDTDKQMFLLIQPEPVEYKRTISRNPLFSNVICRKRISL